MGDLRAHIIWAILHYGDKQTAEELADTILSCPPVEDMIKAATRITELEEENKRLREALKKKSDAQVFSPNPPSDCDWNDN